MKNNQQGQESKSPFLRRSTMVANIFSRHFCNRTLNSNLNPEIGHGHEIIIAFREDSIGLNET